MEECLGFHVRHLPIIAPRWPHDETAEMGHEHLLLIKCYRRRFYQKKATPSRSDAPDDSNLSPRQRSMRRRSLSLRGPTSRLCSCKQQQTPPLLFLPRTADEHLTPHSACSDAFERRVVRSVVVSS